MENRRSAILRLASLIAASHGFTISAGCLFFPFTFSLDWSNILGMDLSNLVAFRKQIAEAQTSIQKLYGLRRNIDSKVADLKELVRANTNFLPTEEREAELLALEMFKIPENITEAVKITLFLARARKEGLTPIQVKEQAEERGFDFSGYTNPMASIHTILKRMKDAIPPQVILDENEGTYTYAMGTPFEVSDESVYNTLNSLAWLRLIKSDEEKADVIAKETISKFMSEINQRIRRSKTRALEE